MDVLIAAVTEEAHRQIFENLAGISPLQRISLYADDVVVFVKPLEHELRAIKEIFRIFGEASGLHVNYSKTTATLIRGSEEDPTMVSTVLGCAIADFPIKYLGLKLAIRPLTKDQWQPVLDRALNFLPAWQ
jgi:hypothetical protein